MASARLHAGLIVTEAVICFALPVYLLFWGVLTAPLWYFAAERGGSYAIWNLVYVVAGCIGLVAVIAFSRYLVSSDTDRRFAAPRNVAFAVIGLAGLWGTATDDFDFFDVNPFTTLTAILPSLCFVHFLILALRKSRSASAAQRGRATDVRAAQEPHG